MFGKGPYADKLLTDCRTPISLVVQKYETSKLKRTLQLQSIKKAIDRHAFEL